MSIEAFSQLLHLQKQLIKLLIAVNKPAIYEVDSIKQYLDFTL